MRVLIIADDLTGALDTAAPFAQTGRQVLAVMRHEDIASAIGAAPDVMAISTSSRHLSAAEAYQRVLSAAEQLRAFAPDLAFKKVDSRLKGNVVPEVRAMLQGLGMESAIFAPALPDQGRFVVGGHVLGMGIDEPIPLPAFPGKLDLTCPDVACRADMQDVARKIMNGRRALAIGARGLGEAIANDLSGAPADLSSLVLRKPLLFAIGSRDPITMAQMHALAGLGVTTVDAPNGAVPVYADPAPAVLLVRSTAADHPESEAVVGQRFAEGVARMMKELQPGTVLLSGGETAAAVLSACGAGILTLRGEVETGMPVSMVQLPGGREIQVVTKSGGFGTEDCLVRLAQRLS